MYKGSVIRHIPTSSVGVLESYWLDSWGNKMARMVTLTHNKLFFVCTPDHFAEELVTRAEAKTIVAQTLKRWNIIRLSHGLDDLSNEQAFYLFGRKEEKVAKSKASNGEKGL